MRSEYTDLEAEFLTRLGYGDKLSSKYTRIKLFKRACMDAFFQNRQDKDAEILRRIAKALVSFDNVDSFDSFLS